MIRVRMSYPDLIEDDGEFYLTETQKTIARVHPVDRTLLEGLWNQFDNRTVATRGRTADVSKPETVISKEMPISTADGFALDLWIDFESLDPEQRILDARNEQGQGICLQTAAEGTVEIVLNDGRVESRWRCDSGILTAKQLHHIVASVDAGPKIITFVIDGKLCDGGDARQFGWGRLDPDLCLEDLNGVLRIAPDFADSIRHLRIYSRPLRTSEAVGNYRAGMNDRN